MTPADIDNILRRDYIIQGEYKINDDETVTVHGSCHLLHHVDKIRVQFHDVTGDFNCRPASLTSLHGSPRTVGGYFDCQGLKLKTLQGAPEYVGGTFSCSYTTIDNLYGSPRRVGNFDCVGTQITSLHGAPRIISGFFDCSRTSITSLLHSPATARHFFDCSDTQITSLHGGPTRVATFYTRRNKIRNFEGGPESAIYIAASECELESFRGLAKDVNRLEFTYNRSLGLLPIPSMSCQIDIRDIPFSTRALINRYQYAGAKAQLAFAADLIDRGLEDNAHF